MAEPFFQFAIVCLKRNSCCYFLGVFFYQFCGEMLSPVFSISLWFGICYTFAPLWFTVRLKFN